MARAESLEDTCEWRRGGEGGKPGTALAGGVLGLAAIALVLLATVLLARPRVARLAARQAGNAAVARDHASAAAWLGLALAMGARDPHLLVERAWHLARLGRRGAALAAYRRAARRLPPAVGDAEYGAARVLAEAGDLAAAEDMLASAVARDPTVLADLRRDGEWAAWLGGRPRFEAWRRG